MDTILRYFVCTLCAVGCLTSGVWTLFTLWQAGAYDPAFHTYWLCTLTFAGISWLLSY